MDVQYGINRSPIARAFFYLIAAGFIFGSLQIAKNYIHAKITKWQTVKGTIIATDDGVSYEYRRPTYSPYAKYSFVVNGRNITGDKMFQDEGRLVSEEEAEATTNQLAKAKVATVFYNPINPEESFLIKDTTGYSTFAIIGSFCTGTVLIVFLHLTKRQSSPSV